MRHESVKEKEKKKREKLRASQEVPQQSMSIAAELKTSLNQP